MKFTDIQLEQHQESQQRPARMEQLPEELLQKILLFVRYSTSLTKFSTCCKVSRQWRRIGLAIHGRLDYSIVTIVESSTRRADVPVEDGEVANNVLSSNWVIDRVSPVFLSSLRSLTVHVLHTRIAGPFQPTGHDFFDSLTTVLEITRKLSTFSLKFPEEGWNAYVPDVPAISGSYVARLVNALPPTVVNLEIDTAGNEMPPGEGILYGNDDMHVCPRISRLLPRLHHLRLRLGHVCGSLLPIGFQSTLCILADIVREHTIKETMRSWSLQRMTVWLPPEETEINSAFARDLRLLMALSEDNGPVVSAVYTHYSKPTKSWDSSNTDTRSSSFKVWIRSSGFLDRQADDVPVNTVNGTIRHPQTQHLCEDHRILMNSPRQSIRVDGIGKLRWPELTEWSLEDKGRWAQDGRRGCRYPIELGDAPEKPFWKAAHGDDHPAKSYEGAGTWACLFPDCKWRSSTIHSLQGHYMYAHPAKPHDGTYYGVQPCPSVGCDRVGLDGFSDQTALENHLLGHHLSPCAVKLAPLVPPGTLHH